MNQNPLTIEWYSEQLEIERQKRIDLARIQTKVIRKLEGKVAKQKKQICRLVEKSVLAKIETDKWIAEVGRLNATIREDGTLA